MKARFTIFASMLAVAIGVGSLRIAFAHPLADNSSVSPRMICRGNLRQIEYVKSAWAAEHHKTTNDEPTAADIYPAFAREPKCPDGGTYSIGRVGTLPTCSWPGHNFSFPLTKSYEDYE